MKTDLDFLVLGAGPAGAVFAALAARDGARVLITERQGYAGNRPGEYLDSNIIAILDAVGVSSSALQTICFPSPAIVSLWDSHAPITQTFRERSGRPSVAVVRHLFDHLLLENAAQQGADVTRTQGGLDVSRSKTGWQVQLSTDAGEREVSTRFVIDATGRAAAFARKIGISKTNAGDLFATTLWFHPSNPQGNAVGPLVIEAAENGWWSLTETPENTQVAVYYTHKSVVEEPRLSSTEHALNCLHQAPYINARLHRSDLVLEHSRSYPAFPSALDTMVGENWIAIGDAAASYDPLCGKGVLFALQSACRAYEACANDFDELSTQYQRAVRFRYDQHVDARRTVYRDAGARLSKAFNDGV